MLWIMPTIFTFYPWMTVTPFRRFQISFMGPHHFISSSLWALILPSGTHENLVEGDNFYFIAWDASNAAVTLPIWAHAWDSTAIRSRCMGKDLLVMSRVGINPKTSKDGTFPSGPIVSFIPFIANRSVSWLSGHGWRYNEVGKFLVLLGVVHMHVLRYALWLEKDKVQVREQLQSPEITQMLLPTLFPIWFYLDGQLK